MAGDERQTAPCPHCKEKIDVTATKCPHCGGSVSAAVAVFSALVVGGAFAFFALAYPLLWGVVALCGVFAVWVHRSHKAWKKEAEPAGDE